MPRGIPKDPNHPRNKNRLAAAPTSAAPAEPKKKRGRPPGKKNAEAKSPELIPKKASSSVGKAVDSNVASRIEEGILGYWQRMPKNSADMMIVRENIKVLADTIQTVAGQPQSSSELHAALNGQVKELMRLTDEALHPQQEALVEETEVQTAAPTPAPAPVVQQAGNNLPTPPSFVPPPFPPAS